MMKQKLQLALVVLGLVVALFPNLIQAHVNKKVVSVPSGKTSIAIKDDIISGGFDSIHQSVAWSPDSRYFAVTGFNRLLGRDVYFIKVYEAKTKRLVQNFPVKSLGSMLGAVAFSPDGKYLAAGSALDTITLWGTKNWQVVHSIQGASEQDSFTAKEPKSIVFSPDGKSLAVLYDHVIVWPLAIKSRTAEMEKFLRAEAHEARNGDDYWEKKAKGELISDAKSVILFDSESARRLLVIESPQNTSAGSQYFTGNLTYTPDGKYLITPWVERYTQGAKQSSSLYSTSLQFREIQSGKIIKTVPSVHVMEITANTVSPNGKFVATGTSTTLSESKLNRAANKWVAVNNHDPIRLWDIDSGEKLMEFGPTNGEVQALSFMPNSNILVSCQRDYGRGRTVTLWSIATGREIESLETPTRSAEPSDSTLVDCAVSPNGKYILAPSGAAIHLFNIK